jgi:hypothetical protein
LESVAIDAAGNRVLVAMLHFHGLTDFQLTFLDSNNDYSDWVVKASRCNSVLCWPEYGKGWRITLRNKLRVCKNHVRLVETENWDSYTLAMCCSSSDLFKQESLMSTTRCHNVGFDSFSYVSHKQVQEEVNSVQGVAL